MNHRRLLAGLRVGFFFVVFAAVAGTGLARAADFTAGLDFVTGFFTGAGLAGFLALLGFAGAGFTTGVGAGAAGWALPFFCGLGAGGAAGG